MNKSTDDPEHLVTPHFAATVIRQVTRKTDSPIYNDDLKQEALLRAVTAVRRLNARIAHPYASFRRIIRNVVQDYLRRRRMEVEFGEDRRIGVWLDMAEAIDRKPRFRQLGSAIASLSICDRTVLQLFYTQRLPIPTIAAIVRSSPSAVKKALHRGRERLRA